MPLHETTCLTSFLPHRQRTCKASKAQINMLLSFSPKIDQNGKEKNKPSSILTQAAAQSWSYDQEYLVALYGFTYVE